MTDVFRPGNALTELIGLIRSGDDWESGLVVRAFGTGAHVAKGHHACHGSLDAARALQEALLPEWSVSHSQTSSECWVSVLRRPDRSFRPLCRGAGRLAQAWLLAILYAVQAERNETT